MHLGVLRSDHQDAQKSEVRGLPQYHTTSKFVLDPSIPQCLETENEDQ